MNRVVETIDIRCQCCGTRASESKHPISVEYARSELVAVCSFCQGLAEAGLVRREYDDEGRPRYRKWVLEWKPGELLPVVEQP